MNTKILLAAGLATALSLTSCAGLAWDVDSDYAYPYDPDPYWNTPGWTFGPVYNPAPLPPPYYGGPGPALPPPNIRPVTPSRPPVVNVNPGINGRPTTPPGFERPGNMGRPTDSERPADQGRPSDSGRPNSPRR